MENFSHALRISLKVVVATGLPYFKLVCVQIALKMELKPSSEEKCFKCSAWWNRGRIPRLLINDDSSALRWFLQGHWLSLLPYISRIKKEVLLPAGGRLVNYDRTHLFNQFVHEDTGEKTQKDPTLIVDSLVAYEGSIRFFDLIWICS
jgi:hypothetical protein